MDNLKECPFCGADAQLHSVDSDKNDGPAGYWISCSNVVRRGIHTRVMNEKEEVIKVWNKRKPVERGWAGLY